MKRTRLAVFASGTGSNFDAIARAIDAGELDAELALLFCDHPSAPVVQKAAARGVEVATFRFEDFSSRSQFEAAIERHLKMRRIDLIALAGYMRILGSTLLDAYPQQIVNIHPSLLPAFPGANSIVEAYEAGVKATGVTVHYVDAGVDTGPIIAQEEVVIRPEMSLAELESAIHEVEHVLYPRVLAEIVAERNRMNNEVVNEASRTPEVAVIMGSSSDWETMRHACDVLEELNVPYERRVVSAHRTPDLMFQFAEDARPRGIKVIIAGAGGAAHLPGMVAAKTIVPVIGVPVQSRALQGMDSLLSIVQMPGGVPVATTSIGRAGAINAGLLAAQMLSMTNPELAAKVESRREEMRQQAEASSVDLV